jgi:hypothetical protein
MTSRKPRVSPLEKFPDHVRAIGMITVEMSTLEASLSHLLGAALGLDEPTSSALFLEIVNEEAQGCSCLNQASRQPIEQAE